LPSQVSPEVLTPSMFFPLVGRRSVRTTHSVRVLVQIFAVMTTVIVRATIRLASLTLLCVLSDWKFLYNQQTAGDPFLK
jgi:hypothetical protein